MELVKMALTRTRVIGILTALIGVVILWALALGVAGDAVTTVTFSPLNLSGVTPWHINDLNVTVRTANLILGVLALVLGVDIIVRQPRRAVVARFGASGVLLVFAVLLWAGRTGGPSFVNVVNPTAILVGCSTITMVLIFGALSGVLCERAGVVNIAIEGQFIGGAFVGSVLASVTNNYFIAGLGGLVVGGLLGALLAFLTLRYQSDQIIVGVVLVSMLQGLSAYLNLQVLTPYPQYNTGNLAPDLPIPLLAKIPVLGPTFFNQSGFFYAMVVLVVVISFGLFKTRWGLRVRAVGEHPKAAESVGINVIRTRYINVILGGAVAGLGGVALTSCVTQFTPGVTSGFGYIALAALIFGRWRPSGAVVASVIFGLSVYLATNLGTYAVPIPGSLLVMVPYVVTIAVVAGLVGRVRAPAADGIPYQRA
jgi:simple sugar transport system permease protein